MHFNLRDEKQKLFYIKSMFRLKISHQLLLIFSIKLFILTNNILGIFLKLQVLFIYLSLALHFFNNLSLSPSLFFNFSDPGSFLPIHNFLSNPSLLHLSIDFLVFLLVLFPLVATRLLLLYLYFQVFVSCGRATRVFEF